MTLKMNYKHITYLLLFLVLPVLSFGAKQSYLEIGNAQYAKGKYNDAQESYQKMLDAGAESVALYFNMGNACFKNGDIPSALWYYEKAHKLAPGDEDINFNIRFAGQRTTDKIDEAPELFINKWWRSFILMVSAHTLAIWSVVLILVASLLLIAYLFTQSVGFKKTSFFGAIVLYVFGLIAILIANRQNSYFDNHHQAIIFTSSVIVKSTPAANAKTLFVLHEGTKVDVLETNKTAIRIKLANGNEGWIGVKDVKEI
jgi:tetratricopeptide (TPR) repeat protein